MHKVQDWESAFFTTTLLTITYMLGLQEKFARRDKTALGPSDRLRLISKLRIWGPIKPLVMKWWPSWLQCKCEWW